MQNSVAVPVIEYRAVTECGRILTHSATSQQSACYEILRDRYMSVSWIEPWSVWEARTNIKPEGVNSAA